MMAEIAMSQATFMLAFHIVALIFLLSVCGFFAMTAALMVGLPVVETWQALLRWLRAAPSTLKQAVVDLPSKLLRLAVSGGMALGVVDPVRLERWRIDRERERAISEIEALRRRTEQHMSQIVKTAGTAKVPQCARS